MKKAIIRVDMHEYLKFARIFFGQIDVPGTNREPSEVIEGDFEQDHTVHVSIEGDDVVLSYLYEPGDEDFDIREAEFKGRRYPCDSMFYSPGCREKVIREILSEIEQDLI